MKYVVYFANNQKEEVVEEEGINNLTLRCMHTKMPRKKVIYGKKINHDEGKRGGERVILENPRM